MCLPQIVKELLQECHLNLSNKSCKLLISYYYFEVASLFDKPAVPSGKYKVLEIIIILVSIWRFMMGQKLSFYCPKTGTLTQQGSKQAVVLLWRRNVTLSQSSQKASCLTLTQPWSSHVASPSHARQMGMDIFWNNIIRLYQCQHLQPCLKTDSISQEETI